MDDIGDFIIGFFEVTEYFCGFCSLYPFFYRLSPS